MKVSKLLKQKYKLAFVLEIKKNFPAVLPPLVQGVGVGMRVCEFCHLKARVKLMEVHLPSTMVRPTPQLK